MNETEYNLVTRDCFVSSCFVCLPSVSLCGAQILIGEVTIFFVKSEGAQEKTIVTADCCYFNPLLRRIVRFLGKSAPFLPS